MPSLVASLDTAYADACADEACAIVTGVNTHNDMLKATIKAVSKDATKLGIEVGMTGAEAIDLLR